MIQRAFALLRKELEQAIDQVDVVSFDIFETLIWRVYEKPTDLFKHIELGAKAKNFAALRSQAEFKARDEGRLQGRQEVTLDDIYAHLPADMQRLKEVEIRQELLTCRRDDFMFGLYQHALECGKRIVLASDMYLPLAVIEKIVGNAGYQGYEKLFLSSHTHNPKATGAMFADISAFTGAASDRILHVGDNHHSDYLMPLKAGLRAFHYVSALEVAGGMAEAPLFERLAREPYASSPATSLLKGLVAHENMANPGADYWERFGFTYGGLIACGFAAWIKERCDEKGLEGVFFLARDGFLFREVFERLYPGMSARYLFASRRCYLLAALKEVDGDFLSLVANDLFISGHHAPWTYRDFLQQLALDAPALEEAFAAEFPNQDEPVTTAEQLDDIRFFFKAHRKLLLVEGAKERDVLLRYFGSEGLLGRKVGVVDLGWKGTLLRSLARVCKLAGAELNALGLYFGTHKHEATGVEILSYALNRGMPEESVLNGNLAIVLLEMMFSAPHGSVLKVVERDGGFSALHQDDDGSEAERIAVFEKLRRGVLRFAEQYAGVTADLPLPVPGPVSVGPLDAFCHNIGPADHERFARLSYVPGVGNVQRHEPVLPGAGKKRFAIVSPWPGSKCAEFELVLRMVRAAENIGAEPVLISRNGYLLTRMQEQTGNVVDPRTLEFAISIHYDLPKLLDTFYYFTLWNPPEIPTGVPTYARSAENYVSFDDYLTAGSGRIESHLRSVLDNSPRRLEGMSELYTSFPLDAMMPPNLAKPTLFYCGMNWEKVVYQGGHRHEGLLHLLDKTGKIKFFGPDKVAEWGGIRAWEGFEAYQGPIPFDGFSIVKEINDCGIVLVISSDDHRRSGMATTRLYEACAGGAVIIADDNPFVQEHFGDAALFIDYNTNDPADTFRQIMEKYDWIVANPEAALALARRAQEVFREKFALETQLQRIFDRHEERRQAVAEALYARGDEAVLAIYVIDAPAFGHAQKTALDNVLENVRRQAERNITLAVACDAKIGDAVRLFLEARGDGVASRVFPYAMFTRKGTRIVPEGRMVHEITRAIDHGYLIFAAPNEVWYRDHVTTLKRALENDPKAAAAHSGKANAEYNNSRTLNAFAPLPVAGLLECAGVSPGEVLFRREVEDYLGVHLYECLDGLEHYAFLLLAEFRERRRIVFSKRISFAVAAHLPGKGEPAFRRASQVRFIQDLVHYDVELRRSRSLQPLALPGAAPAADAPAGGELAGARAELVARTEELVRTRAELVARTEVAEGLQQELAARTEDLVATRQELTDRTEVAEQLQAEMLRQAGLAEAAQAELLRRTEMAEGLQAELVQRTGVAERLQAELVDRTRVAEGLLAELEARTAELARARRGLVQQGGRLVAKVARVAGLRR
ncbi:hypothetical protein EAH89_24590 [Roseomonas nepalensis]|uniref:Spore protein YkvP/CgeB glycosyl transferase-like domain-containing protein n=1 Tax=Muricoccus nepalensis TaxID=1854500 RepID=A0A502FAX9_9PROT|nr:glycosyltransferase [Roseomonas nepalensis]TPG46493.1 hypothetical protein EAH89_24590 [Roseomonas nepalensis]